MIFIVTEENLAHKVCLLLIELHIAMEQPDAALSVITYIENQLLSLDNGKVLSTTKDSPIKSIIEHKEQKELTNDTTKDAFKRKLSKCKVKIYLLMHQLKLCKKEWKTLAASSASTVRMIYSQSYLLFGEVHENTFSSTFSEYINCISQGESRVFKRKS